MERIVPTAEVLQLTGFKSRSGLWRNYTAGRFPRPIRISANRSGWLESDLKRWLADRVAERDAQAAAVVEARGGVAAGR